MKKSNVRAVCNRGLKQQGCRHSAAGLAGLLLLGLALAMLPGCSEVRKVTYPPDFHYLEKKQVQGVMGQLGAAIWEMDELILTDARAEANRTRVAELLQQMQVTAQSLNGSGAVTNHAVIDRHLQQFLQALEQAQRGVELEPPNFYPAGQLSGSCMACHIYR